MAATTPNLGLTLPVGNEKVSRQIINGNNSIIDTAFGSAGAKLLDIELNEVTNVSGAYTGTTYDDRVTSAMKALEIEMGNPGAFRANITVNCGAGYITLSCSDVVGTSTVKVSVLKLVQDPTQVTSTEFDILNNRIGTLDNLNTTDKTSTVAAINEVKGDIPPVINNLTSDSTTSALSAAQGKALNNKITSRAFNVYASIASSGDVVNRLKNGWDTLWTNAKTIIGTDSGIYAISGTLDFPANGNNAALGTYYYHGDINLSNKAGTIYMNQYHNAPFYAVLRHTDGTYDSDQLALKSETEHISFHASPAQGATTTISKEYRMVAISRFYNGANKSALYMVDFSGTAGAITSTFSSAELTVSYNTSSGWSIKNVSAGGNIQIDAFDYIP